jgi:hypothetical protein
MDVAAILALVTKGISIANALIMAGQSAAPAFAALQNLFKGKATITQADMDSTDAVLDALLDDFNLELPPA